MNFKLLFFLCIFIPALAISQTTKLEQKNGFQNYKLGTSINAYSDFKLAFGEDGFYDPLNTYVFTGKTILHVGDVPVEKLFLIVNDKKVIVKIDVRLRLDWNVISGLKKAFGEPFGGGKPQRQICGADNTMYVWFTKKVDLIVVVVDHHSADVSRACSIPDRITLNYSLNSEADQKHKKLEDKIKEISQDF